MRLALPSAAPDVTAHHKDHHQAVEGDDKGRRHLHHPLELVGPHQQRPEKEGGGNGADGVQLAEQGSHDAVKAGAAGKTGGRAVGDHPVVQAIDLDHAGQPGKGAAQQEGDDDLSPHADAAVARGVGVLAYGPDAIAQRGPPQQDVDQDGQGDGHGRTQVQAGGHQAGQAEGDVQGGGLRDLGGQLGLGGIDHRAAQQEVHDLHGDGVHHDCAQDLVDAKVGLQRAWNRTPEGAARESGQQRQGDDQPARPTRQCQADHRAQESADDHLPLTADVDDVGPEGDADAQADQQQRHGLDRRFGQGVAAAKGALD